MRCHDHVCYPVGTDNCAGPLTALTAGQASGTVFPIGTTTVTYEVTDASLNTSTCSFSVTVNDTQNPAITCPADITQNNDAGVCGATITYATPVGTDNCAGPVTALTAGQASGTVFPVGVTTVTYEVTDASSNTTSCSFDVTVDDTENPVIVCPADITQSNDLNVCGATITYATPVGTDNCAGPLTALTAGQASGTVFPIGTTTVTYEVTDASTNTNTCSFDVTVNDTQNPAITCPANITQSNDLNVCGATITYATPVGTDNCAGPLTALTAGQASGTVFPIGTTTVTYEVTDASLNTSTCSFSVTVNDTQNPAITCPANITQSNDLNVCGATITYATPVGTDNCAGLLMALTAGQASDTMFPIGTTTITYEVTNASLNTSTYSFNVTVNDTQNPAITCPADITQYNDLGVCGATITYATPVGTDNCAGPLTALTAGQASGTVFPVGVTTVTYEVTDASSNTTSCSFDVTVDDTENPVIVCPADITQSNDLNVCGATITYATPVGTDNCAGPLTALTAGQASGTVFPIGTTTVTYEVTDASTNTNTCSFDVTVNDTQNPAITCPANITQSNDLNVCGATITYATPVGTDNCAGPLTALTAGQASGTVFPIGTTTVTYEVTDASLNTSTCSFSVTVNDTQNPAITCPANITQSNDLNVCGATITYATPVGTDNCAGPLTALTAGQASGTVFPIGTTTVTYEVTDASLNTSTCSFSVTVNDTQNPAITCPADITQNNDAGVCGATITYATPVGTDNCAGPLTALTAGQASGTVFPVGVTTVTYEVTDASSNTTSCSFDVTVDDNEAPMIICPANISQGNDAGLCGALITYSSPFTSDNCSGAVTILTSGFASGTVFPVGLTTVTYVITDGAGITATCSFDVTVDDFELPVITCPPNISQVSDMGVCGAVVTFPVPVGVDNCPGVNTALAGGLPSGALFPVGTTTVTYITFDVPGNIATCSFDVTVDDIQAPTISCPSSIVQANDLSICGATVLYPMPIINDNCAGASTILTGGLASGSIFPLGTTIVTYDVVDASSNTASCAFTVDVYDNENPLLICPPDQTVPLDLNCEYILADYVPLAIPTDNCGIVSTSQSVLPGTTLNNAISLSITTTDFSGNVSSCSFNVTPVDGILPAIICPPTQTEIVGNSCEYALQDYTPLSITSDNCGVFSISQSPVSGTVTTATTSVVTLTVYDLTGNTQTCTFNVVASDTTSPQISCPAFPINDVFNINCEFVVPDYSGVVTTSDNCGIATITQSPGVGSVLTANQTFTMTTIDLSGNDQTCTFDLIIADVIPPTIGCPGAQIHYTNDTCFAVLDDMTALAVTTANCEAVTVTQTPAPGLIFNLPQTVILVGTDASGNSSFCFFNVTLVDTIRPQISCPGNITTCDNVVTYSAPTATDNCSTPTLVQTSGLPSGSFFPDGLTVITFTATDAAGNSISCSFDIYVNEKPDPTAVVTDVSCNGAGDGFIDVTVTGGVLPYSYTWSTGQGTEDIGGLSGGTYQVIVQESKGCVDTLVLDIYEPPVLIASGVTTDITCYDYNDGIIEITASGGTPSYNYNWTPMNSGAVVNDLGPGDYAVDVVDANGCTVTLDFTINNPDSILISGDISQYPNGWQISCEGCYDGSIDLSVTGGNPSYTYDWSSGSMNEDLSSIPAGTYTVIVTDDNGCENEATFILDQPLAVVLSNAFSPNGDGANDYFQIKNIDRYPNSTLTVMNRWGDVVYKADPYTNNWYGESNTGLVLYGNELPEGSYYYILDLNDGSDLIKGYVVIKR
ncbi:MAG: HYR domain-containing protein [Crocinitomicaceae bacterium]|nr:HYR domain-containing protein [Crocinitomicaceae bacterium]